MAETENTKSQIVGLLEIRRHRGLAGNATSQWIVEALDCLLQAELERMESHETRGK